ncbi:MAG: HlyD family efflux transporter periplasmic adaptor subunit [Lachnospiraceae bacterium]|nr:HlyD family efflux transporter periplasmic adaptor subunit [Lachnospiraceae bacterium]
MKNKEARKLIKKQRDPFLRVVKTGTETKDNILIGPGVESEERKKKKHKKIKVIVLSSVIILIAAGTGIFIYFKNRSAAESEGFAGFRNRNNSATTFQVTGDMVAASGVINVGSDTDDLAVDLASSLKVEEVYVSSGDEITEGTAILKINDDDIEAARKELESELKSAELAYRTGAIEYEQNLITAKYDYDSAVLAGKQAKEVYQATLDSLSDSVQKAQDSLDTAQEQIAEYESYVNDGSYNSYFGVDSAQSTYDSHLELLKAKIAEWGVSWNEVTGRGNGSLATEHDQYVYILQKLYSVLEKDLAAVNSATDSYDEAVSDAALNLQTLQLSLASLKEALAEAKESYEIKSAEAKLTYETSLYNAEHAESNYNTNLEKIEADYGQLKDDYEDAKANLEAFENLIGDGVFRASGSGSVLRVMARAGQSISGQSTILSYSDTTEMTVTVSVDQTDIAKLNVGETAYIVSASDKATYEGKITSINPVTSSESRTDVTYNVTVEVTGDTKGLISNETVTVVFGMDEDTLDSLINGNSSSETEATAPAGGEMPDFSDFGDGEIPDFGNMPEGRMPNFGGNGERPERRSDKNE